MPEPSRPEKRAVRRSFARAATRYDEHAILQREVGARLLQHLDPIRIDPRRVVDLGCGTGGAFTELRKRFPRARLVGIDIALPMLLEARVRTPWWRRAVGSAAPLLACADAERLALAAGCAELAFSNLMLQWCDPAAVLAEAARVLQVGGLFLFSTYGPDTLKELRASFSATGDTQHVHEFVDMHDLGDALVAAGFADPVMEMETVTLEYSTVRALAADLKGAGAHNALPGRPRGLGGRERWRRMAERYESYRRGEALPATYEIVYGHAWKAAPRRTADGRAIVDFHPRAPR
ncbi:MAG TPA: malonyl-ACP O-methyltransferase BioC [Usitatibacter sp.]|nr:malonyl-ACP O-methyltransferase BioC [Usitatibacter sp.]